jgi:type VI secretion system protein ImpM
LPESSITAGIFGKLPANGDFVSRRLPPDFLQHWDEWLQNVILCSKEQLGDEWLDFYLTSPIWRFVLSPNLIEQRAWGGVLMPSVDRVGRYFPLTLAAPLGAELNLPQVIERAEPWFEALDQIALSVLEEDCDIEELDSRLSDLGGPAVEPFERRTGAGQARQSKLAMRTQILSVDNLPSILPFVLKNVLDATMRSYALWWTRGSDRVAPSMLVTEGLPPVQAFAAFLDGQWENWGWADVS